MPNSKRRTTTTARLRNGAHEGVDVVADSLESLRSSATEYVDRGREQVTDLSRTVEDTIRERPMAAILVSTAIGFVLGCMMSRR